MQFLHGNLSFELKINDYLFITIVDFLFGEFAYRNL
jgi:hypothetical protein